VRIHFSRRCGGEVRSGSIPEVRDPPLPCWFESAFPAILTGYSCRFM
jgi:hypothetical protein